ncbi:MAG: hypothetical protein BWY65_02230 [Firmicutes bacterium ADurb.Bin373]|nr:MAG: hypothetical protein BWY65_02230 [Firmicutes bacterium ADurb.Bin373]
MIVFCSSGTSSTGISTPRSPLATIIPSETLIISSRLFTARLLSILEIISRQPPASSTIWRIARTSAAFLINEAAIKSSLCSTPNIMSWISLSVIDGRLIATPGTLTPFWLVNSPPFMTVHCISVSDVDKTFMAIKPSATSIVSPLRTSPGRPGWVTGMSFLSPLTGSVVSVIRAPSARWTGSSLKYPRRISGPLVSSIMATYLPHSSAACRIASIFRLCSSCVPCEKFRRATFIPASINFFKIFTLSLAGPIVQTILVRRN